MSRHIYRLIYETVKKKGYMVVKTKMNTSNEEYEKGYVRWFTGYIDKHTKPFTVTLTYNHEVEEEKAKCWMLNRDVSSVTSTISL